LKFIPATATLLQVRLGTGFLHQIRATLAHLGHPLLGDTLYGGPPAAERVMLHAASSRVEDAGVDISAPEPADFQNCLRR
jgi:23S rRNA pseudouridine1911/1915/1917 synthase